MKNVLYCLFIAMLVAAFLPVLTGAQGQQWLQYRSSAEPQAIVADLYMPYLEPSNEIPDSEKIPALHQKPLIFKWPSPMANNGFLFIALDRESGSGARDLLYIDSNGDGSLKDETAIKAYKVSATHSHFGPVKLIFAGEDGPIVYHLNFRLCDHDLRRLRVSSAGWYEGNVTINGMKKFCMLIDHNANGTFNDKSLNAAESDRIRIGEKESLRASFVGNYIDIDGALYVPQIPRDGAYVKFAKAENVTYGIVRVAESITEFSACGENGLYTFNPDNGVVSLPIGKYHVYSWTISRRDGNRLWKLRGDSTSDKDVFDVAVDKEIELSIGEPIISFIEARDEKGSYVFWHKMKGRFDERIELTRDGSLPRPPKLHIVSKDGRYNRKFAFAYG